ncbi:MAG: ABC transporter ATP-binding protein [Thermoplasmata archaeon]|nr:ABC transporter ATP-binding protein [Thermoplasmata archaeon]MCI4359169.1 ABC transporter ATP-binding protein [Thermoplasmata archaeon]
MSSEPRLEVRSLSAAWGSNEVLTDVSLSVQPGEFVVLMGPNGSGKTTLLRTIAGFEWPTRGAVRLDGRDVTALPPHRRGIGILFQEPALFPGRSVWENIAYGLELARRPDAEVQQQVAALSQLLDLDGLLKRAPEALSGGERQRVALARTLAPGPSIVLLDEPFASVDPERRAGLRAAFRAALRRLGVAAIHVTHDREEGLFLGDRVVLLLSGRVVQSGPPMQVYRNPSSPEAASFLGYNVLQEGGRLVAVDPRDIELRPPGEGIAAEVEASGSTAEGSSIMLRLLTGTRLEARVSGERPPVGAGQTVAVRWSRSVALDGAGRTRG